MRQRLARRSIPDFRPPSIRPARAVAVSQARHQLFARLRTTFFLLFLGSVLIASILGVNSLRITNVSCQLDTKDCPDNLRHSAQTLFGKFIFTSLPVESLGYEIDVTRQFPNTVVLQAKTPLPVVVLQTQAGETFLLTADGFLIADSGRDDLLPVTIDARLTGKKPGDQLDKSIVDSYKELKSMWTSLLASKVSGIVVENNDSIILTLNNESIGVLRFHAIGEQLRTLQAILSQPTIETAQKKIDVRFNNPIIAPRN